MYTTKIQMRLYLIPGGRSDSRRAPYRLFVSYTVCANHSDEQMVNSTGFKGDE